MQVRIVSVVRIVFHDGDNGGGIYKSGEVIDVAVSVVSGDAVFEPEDIGDPEIFAEDVCVIFFGETGVSLLRFAEETFFSGEESAAAVDVDAATFEDDAAAFVLWLPEATI